LNKEEDIPSIEDVREEIRKIDDVIIQMIADRVNLAEKVLKAKKMDNLEINDEKQNEIVLKRVEESAVKNGLDIKKQYELLNKINQIK